MGVLSLMHKSTYGSILGCLFFYCHVNQFLKVVEFWCLHHGFKNWNGEITEKETDYRFYGLTRVEPMVEPMMS